MKIFTASQTRAWDAYTIAHEPIASLALMDRAAAVFTEWFVAQFGQPRPKVWLLCGPGNNGGDGLAVARLLHHLPGDVRVWVCNFSQRRSDDSEAQLSRLPLALDCTFLQNGELPNRPDSDVVVIDALFGSGLNRPLEGDFARVVEWMNALPNEVVSIDLPSGMVADAPTEGVCVQADRTTSFQAPKLAFFLPENAQKLGDWLFADIGLHPDYAAITPTSFHYLTAEEASALRCPRHKFDHKGTFGHALLVCGSLGKMGAAVLAARACLRSGVGLLTCQVPGCGLDVMQSSVPEAMCQTDPSESQWSCPPDDAALYACIGIGCGIGQHKATALALEALLKSADKPMVLDADALNLLAKNPDWWAFLPKNSILTPHPKEFERLFGSTSNGFERLALQQQKAQEHGLVIVLKGAHSSIASPDGSVWFNSTGNPGMATGGSGDVLTGILTGLLAQGYAPPDAARLGVFLHGRAGDLAAAELGQESLIAGDLVAFLGAAWRSL